jgi:hypothetical protein
MAITKRTFPAPGVRVADPEVLPLNAVRTARNPAPRQGPKPTAISWLNPALAAARDFACPWQTLCCKFVARGNRAGVIARRSTAQEAIALGLDGQPGADEVARGGRVGIPHHRRVAARIDAERALPAHVEVLTLLRLR